MARDRTSRGRGDQEVKVIRIARWQDCRKEGTEGTEGTGGYGPGIADAGGMNKAQRTALAASALAIGAALAARRVRASRAIDFAERSVVITGGSRGLGLVLAREFGRHGARI